MEVLSGQGTMELIGDCQPMLINVIFLLKLQPFKMSHQIHLGSLQPTCEADEKKRKREQSCFYHERFVVVCLFHDASFSSAAGRYEDG